MKQCFNASWCVWGISLFLVATTIPVQAQSIQIDRTTPTTPSNCTGSCTIGGGLQHGSNLFHSFSQLDVDSGATVLFLDPGVTNILARVTGNDPSKIRGTLGVSGGDANLFLINPNGIIFGSNAKLDVRGSFVATTANAIQFGNQGFFQASASEVPLLTINPSALFYQSANGAIQNNSIAPAGGSATGLRVPDGRSLLLVGGEVNLNGGRLNAFGGRIELGGLAEPGVIGLDIDNNNLRLSFPENTALANVSFSDGARADVTVNDGGSITVNAGNINISGSQTRLFSGIRVGKVDAQAGDITLNATGTLTVTDGSRIVNRVLSGGQGNSGNINIKAGSFFLSNAAEVQAVTFGKGNAGNVNIDVRNGTVTVIGIGSRIDSSVQKSSLPGVEEQGNGGDITITARELYIKDGGLVNTGTAGRGNAGKIFVRTANSVSLASESAKVSGIFSNVSPGAVGNGGEINIKTRSLSLIGSIQIAASLIENRDGKVGGKGKGGDIIVEASDVTISGTSSIFGSSSGFFTATEIGAEGTAGNITINTGTFRIADGAIVNAQTLNSSRGGNITINTNIFEATNGGQVITTASSSGNAGNITVKGTDRITLSGSDSTFAQRLAKFQNEVQNEGSASGLFASTRANSTGSGGNIAIKTGQLIIQDAAEVSVSSKGKGDAGDIEVNVRDLSLDNQGKLISETQSGRGGNITLEVRDLLLMRRNSQISTNAGIAQARGDGGNITINTPLGFLVAAPNENSDITANAFSGSGGKVTINAKSMFGFVPRTRGDLVRLLNTQESEEINPSNLQTNDITAFSQQNPSFNGIVDIKSPDVDPSQGLLQLPVNVVDTSRQIVASCNPGKLARSKFTLTGRGGIVSSPTEQLTSDAVLSDWITVDSDDKNRVSMQNTEVISEKKNTENISGQVKQVNQPAQIVEAHGWIVDANGNIVLVSQAPNAILSSPALATASCPAQ